MLEVHIVPSYLSLLSPISWIKQENVIFPCSTSQILPSSLSTWVFSFSASTRVPQSVITAVFPFWPNSGSWVNDFKFGAIHSVMATLCFLCLYEDWLQEHFLSICQLIHPCIWDLIVIFFIASLTHFWTWCLLIESSLVIVCVSQFCFHLLDLIRRRWPEILFILLFSWVVCFYTNIEINVNIIMLMKPWNQS